MRLKKVKYIRETEGMKNYGKLGKRRTLASLQVEQRQLELNIIEALGQGESLTENLMEQICDVRNLNQAYKQVRANKGASGIDGMNVNELGNYIREHREQLIESLLDGSYKPQRALAVEIPKASGGFRQIAIPVAIDRLVQQAIAQVLEPILDSTFSESSYGFRPNRNAHQALRQAQMYVQEGRDVVVDLDVEKFFDRVNRDVLMSRLARRIKDKRVLRIVRRFLEAGMMKYGVCIERQVGMIQGSNLAPLLSNLMLDELDKELERRGHKFCRYVDDCNVYVCSQKAGERVMASIKKFLEKRLRLKLNEAKSKVAKAEECKFLGYNVMSDGRLIIAKESISRLRDKIRQLTKRNRGKKLEEIVRQVNQQLRGWIGYFRYTEYESQLRALDGWIRRRLRCYRLKQKKRSFTIAKWLIGLGVPEHSAWGTAGSSKGWWRLSQSRAMHKALSVEWFKDLGLVSLVNQGVC